MNRRSLPARARLATVLVALLAISAGAAQGSSDDLIREYGLELSDTPVKERKGWRKPERILIGGFASGLASQLQSAAPDVEFIVAGTPEARAKMASIDATIGVCNAEVLREGKSIRWIQLVTAGVENCVSIPAVKDRDILVTNMQRITGPVIAEHVIAMTLAFTRGLDIYIPAQSAGRWLPGLPLGRAAVVDGKTMLVVGLGGIGSEVARRAHALGMKVIATRASGRTGPEFVSYVGLPDELPTLIGQADFVVITVPLTPETRGMFDAALFEKMKPSAYLINIARGSIVVTPDLIAALESKKIAGAALDVTDPEPLPPDHPLWKAPNVIITPHVASRSDLGSDAQLQVVRENLRRYVAGDKMLSVVDVARGY